MLTRRRFVQASVATAAVGPQSRKAAAAEEPLGVGIIGVGNRTRQHLRVVVESGGMFRLKAVCDTDPARLAEAEKLAGGAVEKFHDFRDLLGAKGVDVVIIATPNFLHAEMALAALAAGKHVLCEKPMATTMADCRRIAEAAKNAKGVFQCGLQLRYTPVYRKVAELIAQKRVGDVQFIWFSEFRNDWNPRGWKYRDPKTGRETNWRYLTFTTGGTLPEKSCHYFDLFNWFAGAVPDTVFASGGRNVYRDRETIDNASVILDYPGGVRATHGLSMFTPHQQRFSILGSNGWLDLQGRDRILVYGRVGKLEETLSAPSRADLGGDAGTYEMYQYFFRAIRKGKRPFADATVGLHSVAVGLAAERSIVEKRPIELHSL